MAGPLVGVPCSYCDVEASDPCVTAGGWIYQEGCHRARRQLASKEGKSLMGVEAQPPTPDTCPSDKSAMAANKLKLALWYVGKAGGIKKARKLLEMAAVALELAEEDEEETNDN